jgi:two-component system chemotaxis response regulator CheY
MIDLNDELAQDYLADCREHLAAIEADLLSLAMGETLKDEARLGRVYRGVHFIWEGAALFDLMKIRELTYKMEQILTLLRSQDVAIAPVQVRSLISATDKLSELILDPVASNQVNISKSMDDLDRLLTNGHSSISSVLNQTRGYTRPLRVLLAEDDFACRLLLQTFLSRYGECHAAVNGKEAVEAFHLAMERKQPYDLICMDIMMPEMDGREAVRRIRAIEEASGILSTSGVKVIMTTTVEDIKEVILCFQELCDAYLMKPIDLAKLLEQMKHYQLVS